jgi:hypothetical protein
MSEFVLVFQTPLTPDILCEWPLTGLLEEQLRTDRVSTRNKVSLVYSSTHSFSYLYVKIRRIDLDANFRTHTLV